MATELAKVHGKAVLVFHAAFWITLFLACNANAFANHAVLSSHNHKRGPGSALRALDIGVPLPAQNVDVPAIERVSEQPKNIKYSDFLKLVDGEKFENVQLSADGSHISGIDVEGSSWTVDDLPESTEVVKQLTQHKVDVTVAPAKRSIADIAQSLFFPAALYIGVNYFGRQTEAKKKKKRRIKGANLAESILNKDYSEMLNPAEFNKMRAKLHLIPRTGITFRDIAGCDHAKKEVSEIVDFVKNPDKYDKMGCKMPRGILLDGPPGTGKTLFAKALAGEAGVPFIATTGSSFLEKYIGVGPARVRDLFKQARAHAPCFVFIDEFDSVGGARGSGVGSASQERDRIINQLLTELDGYDTSARVMVLAATNRAGMLDKALVRPGRFDRKVKLELPNVQGRLEILQVHSRAKRLDPDIDLEAVARRTPGFAGANLMNVMNEAAVASARNGKETIGWDEIEESIDRVMLGLANVDGHEAMREMKIVAYHESGHAIVGALAPDYDEVSKVSIVPRSNGVGGVTFFAPYESRIDTGMHSKQYMESQLAVALGGRVAEELIFGESAVTTGASSDVENVAEIARLMVTTCGMSDKIGRLNLSDKSRGGGYARLFQKQNTWGRRIMREVEQEVERLVNNSYLAAKQILESNRELLEDMATSLIDREVLSAEEVEMLLVKHKSQVFDYKLIGKVRNREELPFQFAPPAPSS